jgi:hypothetical protein
MRETILSCGTSEIHLRVRTKIKATLIRVTIKRQGQGAIAVAAVHHLQAVVVHLAVTHLLAIAVPNLVTVATHHSQR